MKSSIIWRDDDVLKLPRTLPDLLAVDDLLSAHAAIHTIAIIASTLTPELGSIIRERGMSAQLHCWEHDDLSADPAARAQLASAIAKIEDLVGTRPTVLFPPWNRTSLALETEAAKLGLRVSREKISLEQFIRAGGDVMESVVNFHYWHRADVALLPEALRIATAAAA